MQVATDDLAGGGHLCDVEAAEVLYAHVCVLGVVRVDPRVLAERRHRRVHVGVELLEARRAVAEHEVDAVPVLIPGGAGAAVAAGRAGERRG